MTYHIIISKSHWLLYIIIATLCNGQRMSDLLMEVWPHPCTVAWSNSACGMAKQRPYTCGFFKFQWFCDIYRYFSSYFPIKNHHLYSFRVNAHASYQHVPRTGYLGSAGGSTMNLSAAPVMWRKGHQIDVNKCGTLKWNTHFRVFVSYFFHVYAERRVHKRVMVSIHTWITATVPPAERAWLSMAYSSLTNRLSSRVGRCLEVSAWLEV